MLLSCQLRLEQEGDSPSPRLFVREHNDHVAMLSQKTKTEADVTRIATLQLLNPVNLVLSLCKVCPHGVAMLMLFGLIFMKAQRPGRHLPFWR